jgi:hypothetical protein
MSDSPTAFGRRPYAASLAAGLASSLLYTSIFVSFAFLIPVQLVYGRCGRKPGLAAAGISCLGIFSVQGGRLIASAIGNAGAAPVSAIEIAATFLPSLVLLGALAFMNAPLGRAWKPVYKAFAVSALCALAALPILIALESDASIAAYLEGCVATLLAPLKSAAGEGYDASALMAALDPKELVSTSITTLHSIYAALLFLLIGGSWRLGNRLSGIESQGREETVAIDELRMPYALIWAFLASWALVLATLALNAPAAISAVAWNCALTLSLAYAAQGLGIIVHLFKSWNMPKSMRVLIAVVAAMSLVTPLGLGLAASLPLFGVTEIWIPYRKPKGVGA